MSTLNYIAGDATVPVGQGARIIAHCCNDLGVWGAGFVLALSRRWPEPEAAYRRWVVLLKGAEMPLGAVQMVHVGDGSILVANIIGQHNTWSERGVPPVRYDALRTGLATVADHALELRASVHLPRLGCGLAGGDWTRVEQIVQETLCRVGVRVTVYDLQPQFAGGVR